MSALPHQPGRCRDLVAQISDYLDGELSEEHVAALERHLAKCACCTEFADSLRRAVITCRASGGKTLPSAVRRRARERIAEIMGGPAPRRGPARAR